MCFARHSQQPATVSRMSIRWLVVITEIHCVFCAGGTEILYA